MIRLDSLPDGKAAIIQRYGNPDVNDDHILDPAFLQTMIVVKKLPFPMRISWPPNTVIDRIQVHRAVADSLLDAIDATFRAVGSDEMRARGWDLWGGCFEFRQMRGYPALSLHSWGAAADLCPDLGRWDHREDLATYPDEWVYQLKSRGWEWAGNWDAKYTADGMHFQACTGY